MILLNILLPQRVLLEEVDLCFILRFVLLQPGRILLTDDLTDQGQISLLIVTKMKIMIFPTFIQTLAR